jgi:hypothetical protein
MKSIGLVQSCNTSKLTRGGEKKKGMGKLPIAIPVSISHHSLKKKIHCRTYLIRLDGVKNLFILPSIQYKGETKTLQLAVSEFLRG